MVKTEIEKQKSRDASKRYREKYPDKIKDYNDKHNHSSYIKNKKERIQDVLQYQKDNKDKVNEQHRNWYEERKLQALNIFNNKCINHMKNFGCECTDIRCLQFDHINGGGNKQRRKLGSIAILSYILKHPKEFQLLCANCQWIKRYEKEEHGQKEINKKVN
jgi:hypothetical protein